MRRPYQPRRILRGWGRPPSTFARPAPTRGYAPGREDEGAKGESGACAERVRSGAKDSEQRDRVDAVASGGLGRVYRKGCSRTGCRTSWPFRPLTPLSHCCLTYTSPLDRSPMYTLPTRSTSSRPTRPYPAPVPRVQRRPFANHLYLLAPLRSAHAPLPHSSFLVP